MEKLNWLICWALPARKIKSICSHPFSRRLFHLLLWLSACSYLLDIFSKVSFKQRRRSLSIFYPPGCLVVFRTISRMFTLYYLSLQYLPFMFDSQVYQNVVERRTVDLWDSSYSAYSWIYLEYYPTEPSKCHTSSWRESHLIPLQPSWLGQVPVDICSRLLWAGNITISHSKDGQVIVWCYLISRATFLSYTHITKTDLLCSLYNANDADAQ